MIDVEIEFRGKKLIAHEIGRFLIIVCCGTGDDARHVVLHKPSMGSILCGLTHEEAVVIADTFSIYAKEDPTASNIGDAEDQIGSAVLNWAYNYGRRYQFGFAEFWEKLYGIRPKPTPISAEDLARARRQQEHHAV